MSLTIYSLVVKDIIAVVKHDNQEEKMGTNQLNLSFSMLSMIKGILLASLG